MSIRVTPQDLRSAAQALSGVHRDTGVEGLRTAASLGAEAAGNGMVARSLQEVCSRIELGAAALRAIVRTTQLDMRDTADTFTAADAGGGSLFEKIAARAEVAKP